jgi:phage terminase large subunit-like protein
MSLPRGGLSAFRNFCRALRLETGEQLVLEPFQELMLADYFDGVLETLIIIPKKNYKTTTLAALALFHLCSTRDAECLIGAASRDQATILYDQAAGFIRRSEGLQERLVTKGGYRRIQSRSDAGRIRVLAADVDTADGIIPTLALVDELHRQKSAGLYGVFRDGLGPRNGQMLTISTAGDHEASPLGVMRAAAHRVPGRKDGRHLHVRDGDVFAMHEWALEETDDVNEMSVVKLANPASVHTLERLAQRHDSPSMLPWQWARFACGLWIGAESWWMRSEIWELAESDERLAPRDRIAVGFDGSRYHDATALVACRMEDGLIEPLQVWERPTNLPPYVSWEVETGDVNAALEDIFSTYRVSMLYADPPLWQSEIDEWVRLYGQDVIVRYPTNRTRMMAAVERFRTDLVAGAIPHVQDELLARHVLNAQTKQARGGYWLEKSKTGTAGNIDAAIAAVLAYEARCDVLVNDPADRSEYAFL